jgi:hypothetical protein
MEESQMKKRKQISLEQVRRVGEALHIDWQHVDLEEFRQGLMGHGKEAVENETGLAYQDLLLTGKVVLAHMQEFRDYYSRLAKLEAEVADYRAGISQRISTAVS